jgi:hypothetical protein
MTDSRLVVVAAFPNRIEADLAHGALEAADIESFVSADDAFGVQPALWTEGVRIYVREEDATRAWAVLHPEGEPREP